MRMSLCLAFLSPLVTACAGTSAPVAGLVVRTSAVSYTRRASEPAIIDFTVTNTYDHRVYLARCGPRIMSALDRAAASGWAQYSGDACVAIYDMSPLPIEPGVTLGSSRSVYDLGQYRLRIGIISDTGQTYAWESASATFLVR